MDTGNICVNRVIVVGNVPKIFKTFKTKSSNAFKSAIAE